MVEVGAVAQGRVWPGDGGDEKTNQCHPVQYVSSHLARCHTCVEFGVDGQVVALDGFGYD